MISIADVATHIGVSNYMHNLFVYLHDILKTAAAMITKRDTEMLNHDTWKPIYFGVKGRGHEAQKLVYVGLQTERSIAACCVRKPRWGFPAAIPRRTSSGIKSKLYVRAPIFRCKAPGNYLR